MTNATNIIAPAELASIATDIDSLPGMEAALPESAAESLLPLRGKGVGVNSFLLCVLITKAAKRIRIRAENIGVFLPVSTIMRSVMQAYQLAARGKNNPFKESEPDFGMLKKLDDKILKKEVARHAQNDVKR
jgi:hypothetical protein